MAAKHTPGPWTVYDDSSDGKTNRIELVALGKTVAHIYCSVLSEDIANAALIAASPRLLKALEALLTMPEYDGSATTSKVRRAAKREAKEAIAQAKGEPL